MFKIRKRKTVNLTLKNTCMWFKKGTCEIKQEKKLHKIQIKFIQLFEMIDNAILVLMG